MLNNFATYILDAKQGHESDQFSESEQNLTNVFNTSDVFAASSIQALLNEVQGLLKVAASSARVLERRSSDEIG